MFSRTIAGVSAAALAAGLGFGATQLASADSSTPNPSASASATPVGEDPTTQPSGGHRGGPRAFEGDLSDLAESLGVDEDTLTAAVAAARDAVRPTYPGDDTDREQARAEHEAAFAEALAGELGIEASTVEDALGELRQTRKAERAAADAAALDEAVDEGILTRDEADAVAKAIEAGVVSVHGHGPR